MTIQFKVNTDNIIEFAEILNENGIKNEISGTEDDCLFLNVICSRENSHCLEELEELAETDE